MRKMLITISALLLLLVGCANDDVSQEQADQENGQDEKAEQEEKQDEDPPAYKQDELYLHEFDDPITWSRNDFTVEVTSFGFTAVDVLGSESASQLDHTTNTVAMMNIDVYNETGETISWFAVSRLRIDNEQVQDNVKVSDVVGLEGWQSGVKRSGVIVYELQSDIDELINENEAWIDFGSGAIKGSDASNGAVITDRPQIKVGWPTP